MLNQQMMHYIQRDILHTLLLMPVARFKNLKPTGMESNIFMYHLKTLIKHGFVEKRDGGYALTTTGKQYVDRADLSSLHIEVQPKVITIVAVERKDGKIALLERLYQPFIGSRGLPSGKVHYGESLQSAAERELQEKTNLCNIPLQLRGNFVMRFKLANNCVNHVISYVFGGYDPIGAPLRAQSDYFTSYWGDISELHANNKVLKGHSEIVTLIANTASEQLFFAEHVYSSDF